MDIFVSLFRAKARLEQARKDKEEPASLKNAKKQEQYKKLRVCISFSNYILLLIY